MRDGREGVQGELLVVQRGKLLYKTPSPNVNNSSCAKALITPINLQEKLNRSSAAYEAPASGSATSWCDLKRTRLVEQEPGTRAKLQGAFIEWQQSKKALRQEGHRERTTST